MKRPRKLLLTCLVVLLGGISLYYAGLKLLEMYIEANLFPPDVTDVSQYQAELAKWSGSGLTRQFPSRIPTDAKHARLLSRPAVLQGGAALQLYVELPPNVVEAADKKYAAKATHTFHGGDTNDHANMKGGVPTTFFYTSGTKDDSFDNSYAIYVLEARKYSGEGYWNHGESCGVAISKKHNVVVYWAESW